MNRGPHNVKSILISVSSLYFTQKSFSMTGVFNILRIMYVLEWRTVSALTRWLFLCLFPELWSNEGNKHKNNTRVSAETVHHKSTYIILYLTRHSESVNDVKNDINTSSPCLIRLVFVLPMMSQSIADDVTITRQLWCHHMNNDI